MNGNSGRKRGSYAVAVVAEVFNECSRVAWLEETLEMVWEASSEAKVSLLVAEGVGVTIMKYSFSVLSSFPL